MSGKPGPLNNSTPGKESPYPLNRRRGGSGYLEEKKNVWDLQGFVTPIVQLGYRSRYTYCTDRASILVVTPTKSSDITEFAGLANRSEVIRYQNLCESFQRFSKCYIYIRQTDRHMAKLTGAEKWPINWQCQSSPAKNPIFLRMDSQVTPNRKTASVTGAA